MDWIGYTFSSGLYCTELFEELAPCHLVAHWVFYVFPSNGLRLVQGVTEISLDNEKDFFSYGDIHYEQHGFNVSITDPMNKETTWSRHCGPFWKLIWCKNIWTLKFGYFLSTCICTMLLNVTFWFFLFLLRASPKVFFSQHRSFSSVLMDQDGPRQSPDCPFSPPNHQISPKIAKLQLFCKI